ncbi:MAG: 3-keto-5-aminohexanoate cleavage protein [Candidatus Schekmanbacteria bacterium]|nr:3-keto-5-aminohexanoate cleavage protein [Candidatus Schekmanbacteria bacterium]
MEPSNKVVVSCALTGVLTDPVRFNVPVTPEQMAEGARQARDAGAAIVHCHFRRQEPGLGHLPSWDPDIAARIVLAIRERVPDIIVNLSTGVIGPDITGPLACLERCRPEMAACNAGSLNYLKIKDDGAWAWPPMLFDNPIEKVSKYLQAMRAHGVVPEFECFDTGIVRSVGLFQQARMFDGDPHISLVMGVPSGMPARPDLLPILTDEMPPRAHWQVIAIGREEVWSLHRRCVELGGNVRTGLEDTFYLPDGTRAASNGALVEALVRIVREVGREVASPEEARASL